MARTAKPARRTQPAWLTTLAASIPVRVALLALLATLAYGASLSSGVAWDDAEQLSANPSIRSLERPWRFFTDPSTATPYGGAFMSQYRPLRTLLFAVEFALFRGHAWGYHLVSLLLHGLGAFAVARLTRALFGRGEFLAAAIWLVHPALSDSVLYLAAQGNLLCVLGVLLACAWHLEWLDSRRPAARVGSLVACAGAMLAYEYGLVAPLLVLLAELVWRARRGQSLRPQVLAHLPLWAVLGTVLALRFAVVAAPDREPWWGGSWPAALALQLRIWVEGWRLSLLPLGPIPPRYMPETVPAWITPALAVIVHLVLAALVIGALVRGRRRIGFAAAVVWWYVAQAPTANLVIPIPGHPFASRFLIVALGLPVALVAGWLAERPRPARLAWAAVGLWVAAGVVVDRHQTRVWASTRSLFAEVVRQHPDDVFGHLDLGAALMDCGDWERAVSAMAKARDLSPRYPEVHYALGQLAASRGRTVEARAHFTEALRLAPRHVPARVELARLLAADGLVPAAATWLSGIGPYEHYPAPMRARFEASMAEVALARGDCNEAGRRARDAVRLWPHRFPILRAAGAVLVRCGAGAEGREILRRAAERAREDYLDMVGESALHE